MIASEGEQKSSKALKEAADIIAQSPAALQLRYLQVYLIYFTFHFLIILIEHNIGNTNLLFEGDYFKQDQKFK